MKLNGYWVAEEWIELNGNNFIDAFDEKYKLTFKTGSCTAFENVIFFLEQVLCIELYFLLQLFLWAQKLS